MKHYKYIAVWGTLRETHGNHFRLNGFKKISDDKLVGYSKNGLSLVHDKESSVPVEVYKVDEKTFNQVDNFERMCGYTAVEKELLSGNKAQVWFDNYSFNMDIVNEYSETWTALAEYDKMK
jgi:gamma-glutamylcyclotransferase (GGCT)/AIG2-like uncharacterized protein YtfP